MWQLRRTWREVRALCVVWRDIEFRAAIREMRAVLVPFAAYVAVGFCVVIWGDRFLLHPAMHPTSAPGPSHYQQARIETLEADVRWRDEEIARQQRALANQSVLLDLWVRGAVLLAPKNPSDVPAADLIPAQNLEIPVKQ